MNLEFTVTGQKLTLEPSVMVVANSIGYLKAHVTFPSIYTGTITLNVKRYVNNAWTNTPYTVDIV
jgi:hypothetical protein